MTKSVFLAALGAGTLMSLSIGAMPAAAQAQPRPDTEFCAKMRAQDPGGICTPKGEYVTPEKVYLPDGTVKNRSTGN
jgi:hypothetical protein